MPRKAKVQAVPVEQADQPEGLIVAVSTQGVEDQRGGEEVKTDAEQLTEVINEVKAEAEEAVVPVVEPVVDEVKPKAKAKPKPKAKAKAVPLPEVTPPPVVEEAAPVIDEVAKASCPDCGKQMSAKTLKYSHKCTTAKVAPVVTSRIVEIVEDEVEKRFYNRRAERAARREAVVEKLMLSAF